MVLIASPRPARARLWISCHATPGPWITPVRLGNTLPRAPSKQSIKHYRKVSRLAAELVSLGSQDSLSQVAGGDLASREKRRPSWTCKAQINSRVSARREIWKSQGIFSPGFGRNWAPVSQRRARAGTVRQDLPLFAPVTQKKIEPRSPGAR
jgi:hypothetical protein